ncbi:MAG: hypothetical protein KatS3mg015_2145 [Fimbriimonadales bacterium]|nr:MAG: hypothetical protein KatS3mg015_2145 [Fimbriimonadales bacterium]
MSLLRWVVGGACLLAVGLGFAVGRMDPAEYVSKLESEPLRYEVKFVPSRTLPPGRAEKVQDGVDGEIKRMIQYTVVDGKVIGKAVLWDTRVEPQPAIIRYGSRNAQMTRGYTRSEVFTMEATAYCPCSICGTGTGKTAMGTQARRGVVAVDPSVIPLNSIVYVEGYGLAIAADTGGAVKGKHIDLCFNSHSEALQFGRRQVKVHILR